MTDLGANFRHPSRSKQRVTLGLRRRSTWSSVAQEFGKVLRLAVPMSMTFLCGCAADRSSSGGPAAYEAELTTHVRCLEAMARVVAKEPGTPESLALSTLEKCADQQLALERAVASNISRDAAARTVAVFREQSMQSTLRWIGAYRVRSQAAPKTPVLGKGNT